MAKRVKEKGIKIDQFVSSPAKRAKRTARFFAEEFGVDKDDILFVDDLYMAGYGAFMNTILQLDDQYDTVAVFSHNPGITEFASSLTNVKVDDMPTCAVFALQAETKHWKDFKESDRQFLFFDYPKNPMTT